MNENTPSQNLELIYNKFQEVDKKLKELEISTQRVIVTGGKSNPQPKPINISEEELINIYNYAPQILAEYGTPVSVTADTYRGDNNENIYLEYTNSGYYWIILIENENGKSYYLVFNGDRKINFNRLKNQIESLFIIQGDVSPISNNFSIEKPCKVDILPGGESWQLKAKGDIRSKISPANQLLEELEKLTNKEGKIPKNIQDLIKLLNEHYNSNLQTQDKQNLLEQNLSEITGELIDIKYQVDQDINKLNIYFTNKISEHIKDIYELINQLIFVKKSNDSDRDATSLQQQYSNSIHKETPPPPPPMSEDVRLINLYRENPQGLLKNAIRVSMTKDTVNKVLAGTWEALVELENNNRQGEYYIVASNSNNGDFYLFLDPHTPFNSQTLQQIKKSQLFICNGNLSQTLKGNQISIIKPAIVKQITKNKWALFQSGEIDLVN